MKKCLIFSLLMSLTAFKANAMMFRRFAQALVPVVRNLARGFGESRVEVEAIEEIVQNLRNSYCYLFKKVHKSMVNLEIRSLNRGEAWDVYCSYQHPTDLDALILVFRKSASAYYSSHTVDRGAWKGWLPTCPKENAEQKFVDYEVMRQFGKTS